MATSRKRSRPAAAGTEAHALATRMLTMQAEAGLTIAMRMPILLRGALGDSGGQREATKAVAEKLSAMMESSIAVSHATAMFFWGMALDPLAPVDLAGAVVKVAHSSLEPFSKRTRANAARLSGTRRR